MFDLDVEQAAETLVQRLTESMKDDSFVGAICVLGLVLIFARLAWRRIWRRRKVVGGKAGGWSLSQVIHRWSESDALTVGDAVQGIFCCGSVGSGKTTGSGQAIAHGLLLSGAGGLVATAKPEETALWQKYCRDTGRLKDLVIFGPGQGFNFLRYESERAGAGAGLVENIADLLSIGCEIAERGGAQSGGGGQEDGFFWKNARQQLIRNAIVPLNIAYGGTSVPELFEFVSSAPATVQEARSKHWRANSFCFATFAAAERKCRPEQEADLGMSYTYFTRQLPGSGEKTRGNILMTLTSMVDILVRQLAMQMLCSKTTVTPEMMERRKIVVLDVPIGEFGITGRLIQGIVRYSFQRAMLRRDVARNPRPVFFWADEAQYFLNSFDAHFMSTCRSFRVANILLTQNLSGMYAALGGQHKGKAEADAILACLNTKILHANGCPITNEWAATSIGQCRQHYFNANNSYQPSDALSSVFGLGAGPQTSAGFSEHLDFEVSPSEFTRLRTGGPHNNWLVDAIVFQSGRTFSDTGRTWRRATFCQKS